MKDFSIIFPTRERPELLQKLLKSIEATVYDANNIEVLIAIDEDDPTYNRFVFPTFVKVFRTKRSLNFSRDYYSMLAKQSEGKWIIACNDDAEFTTVNWDFHTAAILNAYLETNGGPNIVFGFIEDNLGEWRAKGHGKYCCFPLLGRDGVEAINCYFPERIPTWGADIWVRKVYDAIDRVIDLPMVINHNCYHNQTREVDHVNRYIQDHQVGYDVNPQYEEINPLLALLRSYVKV